MQADPSTLPYRPCVGVMVINAKGQIFAGQRKDSDSPAWQMPQGGITEDKVDLIAKTHHWITYDLPPELLGKVWNGKYRGQRQKWFLFRFTGQDSDIDIATAHPEFSRWKWVTADEMVDAIVPFKREVYEQAVDAFRAYLS